MLGLLSFLGFGGVQSLGCGVELPVGEPLSLGELAIHPIDWSAAPLAAGRVATIAEGDDEVALFGDTGVSLWTSGDSQGRDSAVRSWRSSAVVPALGFSGRWLLGIDGEGHVQRLRFGPTQSLSLEDVSARYQLQGKPVSEVASIGGALVGFVLDGRLAVSDGKTLKHYELSVRGLVGGRGRAAGLSDRGVAIFDAESESLRHVELPDAKGLALAPDGLLWAATADALYRESGNTFEQAYHVESPQQIVALSSAGSGVWVLLGDSLAQIRDGQLLTAPLPGTWSPADGASPTLRLIGSPSGDAWLLDDTQVVRVGEDSGGGQDLALWRKQMLPVFQRLCQGCHLPSGSAHIDLSTHSSWARYRRVLAKRVVEGQPTPMPPVGSGKLTPEELAALTAWVSR
ncbi:MAG: cytochrome c [Deltaproteobacteria bacterium]|nr:cytochrome c [Deltaproteobacteria bacterium]